MGSFSHVGMASEWLLRVWAGKLQIMRTSLTYLLNKCLTCSDSYTLDLVAIETTITSELQFMCELFMR
jgi:hypothetical protein